MFDTTRGTAVCAAIMRAVAAFGNIAFFPERQDGKIGEEPVEV